MFAPRSFSFMENDRDHTSCTSNRIPIFFFFKTKTNFNVSCNIKYKSLIHCVTIWVLTEPRPAWGLRGWSVCPCEVLSAHSTPPHPSAARLWPFAHVFGGEQSPLQPVMLRVASHKCQCHRGTVINFGALGKMSSRCLFGLSLPTPLPTPCSPACLGSTVASPRLPPAVIQCQPPPLFGGGLIIIMETQSATWPDNDLLFWPQPLFDPHPPRHPTLPRCLLSVCWLCMMGEGLTQHEGAATLHCQGGLISLSLNPLRRNTSLQ